tara:strand:- start:196 stop:366 length:171 start_codon:yes stop_codon:yes gene_type:complete
MSSLDNMFGGNPVEEINTILDEMLVFAKTADRVTDCEVCKNTKVHLGKECKVCLDK